MELRPVEFTLAEAVAYVKAKKPQAATLSARQKEKLNRALQTIAGSWAKQALEQQHEE